jgi:D-alanine-D-alanine ligase-like ATP-grasp enzyme
MANQAWMRQEEESFLKDPHLVFDEQHQAALRAVTAATELDYSGIDCAIDCNGKIVVFETNAAMLVHEEKDEIFAYKNPYITKIKDAFGAKLTRLATGG